MVPGGCWLPTAMLPAATLPILLPLILHCLQTVSPARILMITLGGTSSHKVPFLSLGQALQDEGHRVTLVSAFTAAHRSPIDEIAPLNLVLYVRNFTNWDLLGPKMRGEQPVPFLDVLKYSYQACDAFYSSVETRALLSREVDLLVLDGAYPECGLPLAHHYGVPFIYLNTVAFYTAQLSASGSPAPYSHTPFMDLALADHMGFWERAKNTAWHSFAHVGLILATRLLIEPVVRQHFGAGVPPLSSISRNVSLILQHGHHSVTYPRPYLPSVVEVACIHCRPAKPISEDLEEFLTGGNGKGFVYVSFGTSVKAAHMPELLRLIMVSAFHELPYQVLWKHEDAEGAMPDLPPNVRLARWLPQQDILGHPRILGFVSHGGLNSMLEAVYHAVPMVTLPVFCDQNANSFKAERDGYAIRMDFGQLTAENLLAAVNKVVNDKRYKENVVMRSNILRDQETPPLDRAVYWVQYVLRHRGAPHLHGAARELSFAQYFLLDVLATLAFAAYLGTLLAKLVWRSVFKRVGPRKVKDKVKVQ